MNLITVMSFADELEKMASLGLELGGLGMLAAPTVAKRVTGKKPSEGFKDASEMGGLGTLAYGAYKASKLVKKAGLLPNVSRATDLMQQTAHARAVMGASKAIKPAAGAMLTQGSKPTMAPLGNVTNKIKKAALDTPKGETGSDFHVRGSAQAKIRSPANIRGAKFTGAPVTSHIGIPTMKPGLVSKAVGFLGHK